MSTTQQGQTSSADAETMIDMLRQKNQGQGCVVLNEQRLREFSKKTGY